MPLCPVPMRMFRFCGAGSWAMLVTLRELPRLSAEERALYDDLRDNGLWKNLRLEQKRIGFGWVEEGIEAIVALP
jgi:hypothetical protein